MLPRSTPVAGTLPDKGQAAQTQSEAGRRKPRQPVVGKLACCVKECRSDLFHFVVEAVAFEAKGNDAVVVRPDGANVVSTLP